MVQVTSQILGQHFCGRVPLGENFTQALHADRFEVRRNRGQNPPRSHGILIGDESDRFEVVLTREGDASGEHLVEHHAEAENVRPRFDGATVSRSMFGRHVTHRSRREAGPGQMAVIIEQPRHAEVGDLQLIALKA